MKRTLLALALVAATGTAGAQTVTPPSVGGATVSPPSVAAGSVTTPPVNPGSVTTPSVPGTPAIGGATIMPPSTTTGGITTPSVMPPAVTTPEIANLPAANAEGSAEARARIEADGYSNVQGLTRGPDGKWRGQATRNGARVGLTVDATGRVATE